jgi:hypothetical protein
LLLRERAWRKAEEDDPQLTQISADFGKARNHQEIKICEDLWMN